MCVSLRPESPPPVPLIKSPLAVTCASPTGIIQQSPIPYSFAISAFEPFFLFDPSFSSDDNSTLFGNSNFFLKVYSYADVSNTLSLDDTELVTTDERGHHRRPANSGDWPEGSSGPYSYRGGRGHLNRHAVPRSTIGLDPIPYVAQQSGPPPQPFLTSLGHDVSDDQVHAESTFSYHSPHTGQPTFTNASIYFESNSSSLYTPQYTTLNDPHSQPSPSYNTAYQPPSLPWDISPSSHGAPSPSLPTSASYHTPTVRTSGETFTPDYEYQRMRFTPSAPLQFLPHGAPAVPTVPTVPTSSLGLALGPPPLSQPLHSPITDSPGADDSRPAKRKRALPEHERDHDNAPSTSEPIPIHRSLRLTIPPAPPQSSMVTDEAEVETPLRKSKGRERKPRSRTASGRVPPRRPRTSRHETLPSIPPASAIPSSTSPQSPAIPTPIAAESHFSTRFASEAALAQSAPAALRHFPTTVKSPLSEGRLSVGVVSSPRRQDEEMREQVVDFRPDPIFEHGPTEFPPRPYPGGPNAQSPWNHHKARGKIPGSAMDYLPILEARFDRLERSIGGFVEHRGQIALANSVLPGLAPISNSVPSSGIRPRQQYPQL